MVRLRSLVIRWIILIRILGDAGLGGGVSGGVSGKSNICHALMELLTDLFPKGGAGADGSVSGGAGADGSISGGAGVDGSASGKLP